jgi:eukaryotic-like serine/threonine-protein kinase
LKTNGGGVLGFVIALQSQTELLKPFSAIKQQILFAGLICLIAASVIAWWIAARMAKPIIRLVGVTKQIQEGVEIHSSQQYAVNDEVGVLYDAIHKMGRELKNKADLEQYLADVADNFDETLNLPSHVEEVFTAELKGDTTSAMTKTTAMNVTMDEGGKTVQVDLAGQSALVETSKGQLVADGVLFADRYKIIRSIGAGAMGEVFVARDETLDEIVALKILFAKGLEVSSQDLFKEEIRLARKITHRNILRTFDFGADGEKIYISMEYVHGQDLNALLGKIGKLEIKIGVMLAKQICSAIAAAHGEGIIHRDLNPRNMMVTKMGVLKVMDFGLAMKVEDQQQQQMIVGTPYYLSSEQIRRETLDARTDIYAIGVILFKAFSGRTPYMGKDLADILGMHLSSPIPRLSSVLPDAPEMLDDIISKALAKDKIDRFQSVSELQAALQQLDV